MIYLESNRQLLKARINNYENLESYLEKANKIYIILPGDPVVGKVFSVVFNHFTCFELAKMMTVCKNFFLLSRGVIQVRLNDLIAEKQLLQRHLTTLVKVENAELNASLFTYSGPTGC